MQIVKKLRARATPFLRGAAPILAWGAPAPSALAATRARRRVRPGPRTTLGPRVEAGRETVGFVFVAESVAVRRKLEITVAVQILVKIADAAPEHVAHFRRVVAVQIAILAEVLLKRRFKFLLLSGSFGRGRIRIAADVATHSFGLLESFKFSRKRQTFGMAALV